MCAELPYTRVTSRASMVEMKGLPCLSADVVIALKKRFRRSLASKADTPTPARTQRQEWACHKRVATAVHVDAKAKTKYLLLLVCCSRQLYN